MSYKEKRGLRFCIFPGYNWCGPGCNGPGGPVNEVDAACKAHDICYQQHRDHCSCDQELLQQLQPYIHEHSQMGRHARILYNYIRLQTKFTCNKFKM